MRLSSISEVIPDTEVGPSEEARKTFFRSLLESGNWDMADALDIS
jgi:hypothetical protein